MIGLVDKAGIAALIPHAGPMCLLDAVLAWDMTTIACVASSHRSAGNPLAANDRLDAVCGVEYASQAMAVHAGLIGNGRHPSFGLPGQPARGDLLRRATRSAGWRSAGDRRAVDSPGCQRHLSL